MSKRKKGCCGCLTALFAAFFIIGIFGGNSTSEEPKADETVSANVQEQATEQPEETLEQTITAVVSDKYDECDIQQDASSVTVKIWDDSISSTIGTVQSNGNGTNDPEWTRIKNGYLDTSKYIQGLIQEAGENIPLNLSVLNNTSQNLVVLTFFNSDLTYDILAAEAQTSAPAEPAQTEPPTQPEQATQPSQTEQTPQSNQTGSTNGGSGYNFDTYDNAAQQQTPDSYVLNTDRMKFHYPSCADVKKIAPQNYATSNQSAEELRKQGYSSCGHCKP